MSDITLPVVIVGLPGSGKSKVGRLLAASLGVAHVDTDDLVEEMAGVTIAEIFAEEGEAAFRAYEARAVERAIGMGGIVSLGGGAVTTAGVREIISGHCVVHIDVDHDELLRRTSHKTHRPLLADDPDGALRRLRAERSHLYDEVATHVITSDHGPAQEVAQRLYRLFEDAPTIVEVGGAEPYPVVIGPGLEVPHIRAGLKPTCTKVLLIHAPDVAERAASLAEGLVRAGLEVHCESHPDAEAGKTIEVVAHFWDVAGRMRLGRHDAIVAVGGGATNDMAGFVAATWLRGIDVVQVPTTLLAMVDAAVGGKTGINTATGKNLVGSFHPPSRVLVDPTYLTTLPVEDLRAGAAEIVKCGFIRDPHILELIEEHGEDALSTDSAILTELITRAVRVKAGVVSSDLKESGLREILNYGHTLAHAIERCEDYQWRHGDAVSVGCVFAAELGRDLGLLTEEAVEVHRRLFASIDLPIRYSGAPLSDLVEVMLSDKKVRAGQLRFVLLGSLGMPVVRQVRAVDLRRAAAKVGISVD